MQCESELCDQPSVMRILEVRDRVLIAERHFCQQHGSNVAEQYAREMREGTGIKCETHGMIALDLELMINDGNRIERVVLREVGGSRTLTLPIGFLEMCLLYYCVEKSSPYKSLLPHATMARLIERLGCELDRVVIDNLNPAGYFEAKALLTRDKEVIGLQVRPSDGLCLAIVCGVPFVIDESLLREYKLSQQDGTLSPI